MPFTLFHLGPGAALKAAIPSKFSFAVFCCAQVLTDLEPVYYDLRGLVPVHRHLHTFLGATVLAVFCTLASRPLSRYWGKWSGRSVFIPWWLAFSSALVGTYSHVFLDSLMHQDIAPFSPFTQANPMLQAIDTNLLHVLCAALGFCGLLFWLRTSTRRQAREAGQRQ